MSNATRCRRRAAGYARRAETAAHPQTRRALRELERLWLEIAPLAERFDVKGEARVRERIYSLIDAVGQYRRHVACEADPRGRGGRASIRGTVIRTIREDGGGPLVGIRNSGRARFRSPA